MINKTASILLIENLPFNSGDRGDQNGAQIRELYNERLGGLGKAVDIPPPFSESDTFITHRMDVQLT